MSDVNLPVPHAGGRPSDYRPEYCEQVIELAREGMGRAEIAMSIGVVRATLTNWEKVHPQFLVAMTHAEEMSLAWWSQQGRKGIWAGSQFNASAYSLQVRNRFPRDFRDKVDHEHTGKDGGAVQSEVTIKPDLSGLDQAGRDALRTVAEQMAGRSEGNSPGA